MNAYKKKKTSIKDIAVGVGMGVGLNRIYDDFTGQEFVQFETTDGNVVSIWTDTDNNGIYDMEFVMATPIDEIDEDIVEEVVQAEIIPMDNEGISFSDAFLNARNELGPGGIFEWNGQNFNTFLAEEWDNMSNVQHNDWALLPISDKLEYYGNINDDNLDDDDSLLVNEDVSDDFDNEDVTDDFDDESYDNNDAGEWELI